MGDVHKPTVFCDKCGKEEIDGLEQPCTEKFYAERVDTVKEHK